MAIKSYTLLKFVPKTFNLVLNDDNNLNREQVSLILNNYDNYALSTILSSVDNVEHEKCVMSMGPLQIEPLLKDVMGYGFKQAYLLSDKAFAGSDVLATTKALSNALETLNDYSLIVCGKQSTDSDTGQIGYSIASALKIPVVDFVIKIDSIDDEFIYATRKTKFEIEQIKCKLPCVVIVEANDQSLPLLNLSAKLKAKKAKVNRLSLNDLNNNNELNYGFEGSATYVTDIKTISLENKNCQMLSLNELKSILEIDDGNKG